MILRIFVIMLLSFSIVEAKSLVMTVFKSNDFVMKEQLHLQNHLSMIVSKILGSELKLITGENIGVELEKKKNLEMEDCVGDCSLSMKRVLGADWIFICRVMDMDKFMSVSIELYDKEDNLVEVVNRDLIKSMSDILKVKRSMSFIVDKFRKYFPRKESYGVGELSIDKRDDYSFGNADSIRKSNGAYNKVRSGRSRAAEILNSLDRRKDSVSNEYELEVSRDAIHRDRAAAAVKEAREMAREVREAVLSTDTEYDLGSRKSIVRRFSRKEFDRVIAKKTSALTSCVQQESARYPEIVFFRVQFMVQPNGRFINGRLVSGSMSGNRCVFKVIKGLKIKPFDGTSKTIILPFKLESNRSFNKVYSADDVLKGLKSKNKESSISSNSNLPSRLERSDILSTIRKNQHSVNVCKKLATEKTRVSIRIIINKSGKVSSAILVSPAQLQGSPFEKCLVNQVSRFVFPKFNGADMGIKLPFIL